METYKKYGKFFLCPNIQTITSEAAQDIYDVLSSVNPPAVINMEGVESCSNDFLFMLKKLDKVTLLNAESQFLSILYMTGFDKYVKVYGDSASLFDDKRELINRSFCIV